MLFLLLLPALASAQGPGDASPYLPLDHWAMPYVEHLIARGRLTDPTPLTRPFHEADLLRALEAADSARLSASELRIVRRLVADLTRRERGAAARLDLHAGVAARSHARRDPLRAAGDGHGTASGGAALTLFFGPAVVVTHPYFDTRLKWDPDYLGKRDRVIAGRNAEAYVAAQWRYGEIFFGALDRNWGPSAPGLEGLLLSPSPYSYGHLGVSLGTAGVRIEGILAQLDDLPDTGTTLSHRYWVAHRLVLRPPGRTTLALWEGSLLAGPGRQLEPGFANIFTLGLLEQLDQDQPANSLVGVDVITRIGRARVFGSVLIDDFQVDRQTTSDREPPSYGVTLGAQGGLGGLAWTAFYTRVANLAYRTSSPAEVVMRRGVGLARNFSDYDQVTLRASLLTAHRVLLTPEVTLLRQGEGDFRLPYPPVTAYDSTPAFLSGVVERTVRLALGYRLSAGSWSVGGDGGVHLISNAGHVSGTKETRWVGSVGIEWRYRRESLIP